MALIWNSDIAYTREIAQCTCGANVEVVINWDRIVSITPNRVAANNGKTTYGIKSYCVECGLVLLGFFGKHGKSYVWH